MKGIGMTMSALSETPPGATGAADHAEAALAARGVSKTFNLNRALSAVDLDVLPGEIHALLGENGSGKSTLIKILAGYHRPDPGCTVHIGGKALAPGSPTSSHHVGARFVHQDLALVAELSVLDNLALGTGFPTRFGTIRGTAARREAAEQVDRFIPGIDPTAVLGTLTAAQQTGVAVVRALREDPRNPPRLLVLDEPTATLPIQETDRLFEIVRAVAASGVGVLYVTHRLDEVFELTDKVSVLRDGVKVVTTRTDQLDRPSLIAHLVGSEFEEPAHVNPVPVDQHDSALLAVEGIVGGTLDGATFRADAGEIVGITGITGSGRETVLSAIFGAVPYDSGSVRISDASVPVGRPDKSVQAGLAFLPSDRKTLGGLMTLTSKENVSITDLRPFWRRFFLSGKREIAAARDWFVAMDVRPRGDVNALLGTYSGGNQQKILFAKWCRLTPRVFLLDEPTQGVDIAAKVQLHEQLVELARSGTAVVIASSDQEELASLCTRVLVMSGGRIVSEVRPPGMTAARLTKLMLGGSLEEDRK